ncbi:MAG: hypothetical protein JWP02_2355 [Acidimicrobiales bacterium]|nr:hypothetical protein [Acidimicrobiales bacterium]
MLASAAIVAGAAGATAMVPARAAATDLGGYDLAAQAHVLEVIVDSDTIPVPAHPVLDATLPHTSATLQSGPLGHGLASMLWPGALAGHFGTALKQLDQLCTTLLPVPLPGVPTQCLAVPQQLKDNADALNDPAKAETFVPGGPAESHWPDSTVPGLTMSSRAAADKVESIAGFTDFGAPGLATVGPVQSRSIASTAGGKATSDATSDVSKLVLAGGLVTVDHVVSTARQSTDGTKAIGTGTTVVSGLKVGGLPATVDESGVHIGSLTGLANQALNTLGLSLRLTAPVVTTDGAKGSSLAPVLVIGYRDDANALEQAAGAMGQKLTTGPLKPLTGSLQQLVQGPQSKVTIALGGASATVDGSTGFDESVAGSGTGGSSSEATPSVAGTSSPGTPGSAVEGLSLTAPGAATRVRPAAGPVAVAARFIDSFGGLAWGLVLLAVAASVAIGLGLARATLAADAANLAAVTGPRSNGCPHA